MASELTRIIEQLPGPVLFIGTVLRAAQLGDVAADLFVLDPRSRKARLARQATGLRVVRGEPAYPPLRMEQLGGVIVVETLGRQADGLKAVSAWRDLLRPGGGLLILEPESVTPIVSGLRRLMTGAPAFRPPEAISAMLLNAGLASVGQQILQGQFPGVLTRGVKRVHAVARDE